MPGYFGRALICANGHLINPDAEKDSWKNLEYCPECGSRTIDECQHCNTPIRGNAYQEYDNHLDMIEASIMDSSQACHRNLGFSFPKHCHACNKPYPWTETAIREALLYTDDLDKLGDEEKGELKAAIPELLAETPKTPRAISTFAKLAPKAGKSAWRTFERILAGIISEAAKRQIWPE